MSDDIKALADKFNKPTEAEALAEGRATKRNTQCPCGCGKKAKKCLNGRLVLQFKHLLRGSVLTEVLLFCAIIFALGVLAKSYLPAKYYVASNKVLTKP